MRRPSVSSVSSWDTIFESDLVKIEQAAGGSGDFYYEDFYRVSPRGKRSILLYGETAWSDSRRIASDYDFAAWRA